MTHQQEKEYEILKCIENGKEMVRQRDMAEIAGLSLGMVNSILKRLIEKGFVMAKRLNSHNFQYLLTPSGLDEHSQRSYGYLKRTLKSVTVFKRAIEKLVIQAKKDGFSTIVLVGQSELEFIFEHACLVNGLTLVLVEKDSLQDGFLVYSEEFAEGDGVLLRELIEF